MFKRYSRRDGARGAVRFLLVAAMVPLVVMSWASPALAGKPTGGFKNFTLCPLKNTKIEDCIFAETHSGEVKLNKQAVPITNPLVLQGGTYFVSATRQEVWVNAEGGNTLSKSPQNVPGGLLGLMPPEFLPEPLKFLFEEFIINKGPTGVTATTELAGEVKISANNLTEEEGPALTLPVKVHLENTFLGEGCYIGSSGHPLTLALTSGETSPKSPNSPITGVVGKIEILEKANLLRITENKLVNNEFSAPAATGCVNYVPWWLGGELIEALANKVIDEKIGLAAEDGYNTAILNNTIEKATASAVKTSE